MSGARPARSQETENAIMIGVASAAAILLLGTMWVAIHGAAAYDGDAAPPANPIVLLIGLVRGRLAWPTISWLIFGAQWLLIVALSLVVWWLIARRRGDHKRGDTAAKLMGTGRAIASMGRSAVAATAKRLGVESSPGVRIARTVSGGRVLYQDWEDVAIDIWGPRQGKTTARVIPSIVEAPGAVVVTSNKRDVVDATRWVRHGTQGQQHPVWVFDPQSIAGEDPTWWWNPLSYVTGELTAHKLAHILVSSARTPGAKVDAFFDSAGEELLAGLILAAATAGKPITQVYLWLTRPTDTEPATILKAKYALMASSVRNHIDAPDKQRDGVFGTARTMVRFMTNPEAMEWIEPPKRGSKPQFEPEQFVQDSTATLYLLSKEGEGSTGPIMTALTVAISEAAEAYSQQQPDGRLPVPMLLALDEAANICRWDELPNLYSHFGSRGIVVMTILQSWAQGEAVWGRDGMTKLWAAATVKVVGSGVGGASFLSDISALIGDWQAPTYSYQSGGAGRGSSHTSSRSKERIMDPADIASMPRGRAIVIGAGSRPALCRTIPWMDGPFAEQIRDSITESTSRKNTPLRPVSTLGNEI